MQYKIIKRWPFIKKVQTTSTSKREKPSGSISPSWSLYLSITELPLSRWIDLTVNGYKYAIVKEGTPPEHEIAKAESDLRIQYADAVGDFEYRMYCSMINEISRLEINLTQIHSLIRNLSEVYVPVFAKELNRILHTNFVFDVTRPEEYDNNLLRCLNRSKGIKINIDLKKIALLKLEEKYKSKDGKATREYYMGILISLSDEAGYPLQEDITVWEFCERIRRYKKTMETLKNRKNG